MDNSENKPDEIREMEDAMQFQLKLERKMRRVKVVRKWQHQQPSAHLPRKSAREVGRATQSGKIFCLACF